MGPQMWRWSDVSGCLISAHRCTVSGHDTVCTVACSRLLDKGGFASQICHEHFDEGWRAALSQFCNILHVHIRGHNPRTLHSIKPYSPGQGHQCNLTNHPAEETDHGALWWSGILCPWTRVGSRVTRFAVSRTSTVRPAWSTVRSRDFQVVS